MEGSLDLRKEAHYNKDVNLGGVYLRLPLSGVS